MRDETYFRLSVTHAWHVVDAEKSDPDDGSFVSLCGRVVTAVVEQADRVPNSGFMCRACGRSLAAAADKEG